MKISFLLLAVLFSAFFGGWANAGCPPATPCGAEIKAGQGGTGVYWSPEFELGETSTQPFPFEYDAYSIPDQFDVFKSNDLNTPVWSTKKQVSGFDAIKIPYDAAKWGTTRAKVRVTGNNDPNTAWVFTMGCPGGALTNDNRNADRVDVGFYLGFVTAGSICGWNVDIDGTREHTGITGPGVTGVSGIQGFAKTLSAGGPHSYKMTVQCENNASGKPNTVQFFYSDRQSGSNSIKPPSGTFYVH